MQLQQYQDYVWRRPSHIKMQVMYTQLSLQNTFNNQVPFHYNQLNLHILSHAAAIGFQSDKPETHVAKVLSEYNPDTKHRA